MSFIRSAAYLLGNWCQRKAVELEEFGFVLEHWSRGPRPVRDDPLSRLVSTTLKNRQHAMVDALKRNSVLLDRLKNG